MFLPLQLLVKYCRTFGVVPGVRVFMATRGGERTLVRVPGVVHPFRLRKGSSDLRVFHQVFVFGEYEVPFPAEPKVIVDAGSNIGLFAVRMKNRFPKAKVLCIEPDPGNFAVLRENMAPYSDVVCEPVGLWSREAKLRVTDKYGMGAWGMTVEEDPENGTIEAASIPVLMRKHGLDHIDILKLDIETSEKEVFRSGYEEWLPKVRMIVVELHDSMLPGCAKAFFTAIGRCYPEYRYSVCGENTIVRNMGFVGGDDGGPGRMDKHAKA